MEPAHFRYIHSPQPLRDTYVRDISQAYIQSDRELQRPVFLKPPEVMRFPHGKVLRATRPLYGIPESGRLWFETYHEHHSQSLNMTASTVDPCLLFNHHAPGELPNVTALQVDDSIGNGTQEFLDLEESAVKRFNCKPRTLLRTGVPHEFNGMTITHCSGNSYSLTQSEKLSNAHPQSKEELVALRAKLQYVAGCVRPDLAGAVQLLSSAVRDPTPDTFKLMREINDFGESTRSIGLKFVYLENNSLHLVAFTNAAFGNAPGLRSQMGFLIVAADDNDVANIFHYGSARCRRVARSVVTAERLALVEGFDAAFMVKHAFSEMLQRNAQLDMYTDSRTAFNIVAKDSASLERRLQIDVEAVRESHSRQEIRNFGWIPAHDNPADGLTRLKVLSDDHPLRVLMRTNKLKLKPTGWATPTRDTSKPSNAGATVVKVMREKRVRFDDETRGDASKEKE